MKLSILLSLCFTLAGGTALADVAVVSTNATTATDTNVIHEPGDNFTNSVKMELVKVPGNFWAGKFEVTQKEYQEVTGENPSDFSGEKQPVNNITWNEAVAFCEKLTALDLKKKKLLEGYHYTLPTEDEWAGLVGDASITNAVTSLDGNRRLSTSPVGSLGPNNLGLYDVRGNVMEFVLSDSTQAFRFLKGGSWQDFTEVNLRPEFRWYCKPDERQNVFGIRCLLKAK